MKQTRLQMGMPITVEIVDKNADERVFDKIFGYFKRIDEQFSVYKETSEISRINRGEIAEYDYSPAMREVFALSYETKKQTNGFFNIERDGCYNPSGLVKGWAIYSAALMLRNDGFKNFYIDAGGDIQTSGKNSSGENWRIGLKNPLNQKEIVKVLDIGDRGVATSGTYIRGNHIYNPNAKNGLLNDGVVSLTVIGPNVYEADRFATAAFAMGKSGNEFIQNLPGFEGYMIDKNGLATYTNNFEQYVFCHREKSSSCHFDRSGEIA